MSDDATVPDGPDDREDAGDRAEARRQARRLGATAAQADVVVSRLADAGLLHHGVAVVAVVAAARAGVEPADALAEMAAGAALPRGISDYELRAAREEAEAEWDG